MFIDFSLRLEQAVRMVTPDLSNLSSHIVVAQVTSRVVKLGDFRLSIGDIERDVIRKITHILSPGKGTFPSIGFQIGCIFPGYTCAKDCRQRLTGCQHTNGVTLVGIEAGHQLV